MMATTNVVLFDDSTSDRDSVLRRLVHEYDNSLLESFLQQASSLLREEVGRQPKPIRDKLPQFSSITELIGRCHDRSYPIIDYALLYIYQIGSLLAYCNDHSWISSKLATPHILGFGTGLLAATTVASSGDATDLSKLGPVMVVLALKLGIHIHSISRLFVPQEVSPKSGYGSLVIEGLTEEEMEALLTQCHTSTLPSLSRAYISASYQGTTAVTGPLLTLLALAKSSSLQGHVTLVASTAGALSAPHVYGPDDVEEILHDWHGAADFRRRQQRMKICTPTRTMSTSKNAYELLKETLLEVLATKIDFSALCRTAAVEVRGAERELLAFGRHHALKEILSALELESSCDMLRPNPMPSGSRTGRSAKIAIVGFSGRFPSARDAELLWELLRDGRDVHRKIPGERFNVDVHFDPVGKRKNTMQTPYGCFVDEPGLFDPRFFNVSPREAAQMDPVQRLTLITAYEALEMAGFVPDRTPATQQYRVGTFYGQASDDWRETNSSQDIDTYFIPCGIRAFTPGRINYHFKLSGPSYSVDTACSSSCAAIQLACTSLSNGECDTAITGGANILTNPDIFTGLSRGHFLSETGQCKTFDNQADGYCRADGVASLILKRLEDAEADNDNIFGVILGSKTNHSAEAASITRPHHAAQAFLCRSVMEEAGVNPYDVEYVEMHGTGTQAGDYHEILSVSEVFAPRTSTPRPSPLYVGTVKANVGHGEAAAGVTSLVKILKMWQHNAIPPHVGIKSGILNQRFPEDLEARNLHIPLALTPWPRHKTGSPRLVFLNNFSAAGGNTAMLLQEGPLKPPSSTRDPRSHLVVCVSARSASSLKNNMRNLAAYIAVHSSVSLEDLSYTTTARRMMHNYRFALSAHDLAQVRNDLTTASEETFLPTEPTNVAFVFTGQGSVYCSLGRALFETSSQFRSTILRCEQLAERQGFPSFTPLIDGSLSELSAIRPLVVHLGIVCVQMALAELYMSWGIQPSAVIGHSIGEYAALYTAGVLSASSVIHIIGNRGRILEERCKIGSHAMLAVKAPESSLAPTLIGSDATVACANSPNETVLAGSQETIDAVAQRLSTWRIKCKKLEVTHAFHSSQMDPIMDRFESVTRSAAFAPPKIPVISSLMGRVVASDELNYNYLLRHTREKVNFLAAVSDAKQSKVVDDRTIWVEIGSHPICIGMLKSILSPDVVGIPSLRKSEDPWSTVSSGLATLYNKGLSIDWSEYHRDFDKAHRLLTLPPYAFDLKNYWIPYLNHWCLYKGDPAGSLDGKPPPPVPPPPKKHFTPTVQEILEEKIEDGGIILLAQSDLSHPKLRNLILGHVVNGAGLCPSAVYAEMALTIADYLHKKRSADVAPDGMDVCSMEVDKPLILNTDLSKPQLIQIAAHLRDHTVNFRFYGVNADGAKTVDHAVCRVKYANAQKWLNKWNRSSYLIHNQIQRLENAIGEVSTHRLGRGMAYKLFTALVDYDESYRGMDEVILDATAFDASAKVTFKSDESDYYMDPRWIDNLCHITGFIVNASEATQSDEQVYISHGWESLRFGTRFSYGKSYRTYARMQLAGTGSVRQGDVYILDGETIVGLAGGVKFQCVPRKLLDHLLPPVGKSSEANNNTTAVRPSRKEPSHAASATKASSSITPTSSISPPASSVTKALEIIATECGVEPGDLGDNSAFEEFGIDSLLSLTILARIREELDVPLESGFFMDNPTVADLKRFFGSFSLQHNSRDDSVSGSAKSSTGSSVSGTPAECESDTTVNGNEDVPTILRTIIANEVGVEVNEITDNADLTAMGLDSLMSLSITAGIREQTDLTVPDDLLSRCTTVMDIEKALGITHAPLMSRTPATPPSPPPSPVSRPHALSFLIQGNPRTARETVFFFPDGSGSATSYAPIPPIGKDVCAYSLNCPFMKTPEDFRCGIDGVSSIYVEEVKRRQPKGPYNLGGWSAGGVMAYEAAWQLQAQGETVSRLILIDAPCPVKLEPVPSKLFGFFDSIGVLGDRNQKASPPYLIPHFEAMIRNLDTYIAKPFPRGKEPQVLAIWAQDGVCKNPEDPKPNRSPDDPKVMDWLLNNRVDFGANGWDQLLAERFKCVSMEGNHFSMIVEPLVKILGRLIANNF